MWRLGFWVVLVWLIESASVFAADSLIDSVARYRAKFFLERSPGVPDVYNYLKLQRDAAGMRNVRSVLPGLVYRGGADNRHTPGPNPNRNPLPAIGQENLCRLGFSEAVYLYPTNYSASRQDRTCRVAATVNQFRYSQHSVLRRGDVELRTVLQAVHRAIVGDDHRPIYLHCWNGWHASGYISALVLRQFCNVDGNSAVNYWDRNAVDPEKYETIRTRIRNFVPIAGMSVTEEQRRAVCPELN